MLISHPHQFIFIKTVKTASTSVEAFFEPLCTPPGHQVSHHTSTLVSSFGIVGRRGPQRLEPDCGFYNHMSAAEIRAVFPLFDAYRRFTVVRDPYDQAVSWFHFQAQQSQGGVGLLLEDAAVLASSSLGCELRKAFLQFIRSFGIPRECDRLCVDGGLAVHRWLRFESLVADIQALIGEWSLPLPAESVATNLPAYKVIRHKATVGLTPPPLAAYLSREAVITINEQCAWTFAAFGYPQRRPADYPSIETSA